jgi:L,D-transpeptidase ErfK/SrfK
VINTLLKREELGNLRLDWDMVREVGAAEDGLPVPIADSGVVIADSSSAEML